MPEENQKVESPKGDKPPEKMVPESQLLTIKKSLEHKVAKLEGELNSSTDRLREYEAEREAGRLTLKDGTEEEIALVKRELIEKGKKLSKLEQELKAKEATLSEKELKFQRAELVDGVRTKMKEEHGIDVPAELLTDAEDIEKAALGFVLQKLKAQAQKEQEEKGKKKPRFDVGGAGGAKKSWLEMDNKEFEAERKKLLAQRKS